MLARYTIQQKEKTISTPNTNSNKFRSPKTRAANEPSCSRGEQLEARLVRAWLGSTRLVIEPSSKLEFWARLVNDPSITLQSSARLVYGVSFSK